MKLSDHKIDPAKREKGDWVERIPSADDLRLHVRGANNRDWRVLQSRLIAAVPANKRVDGLDPDEQDKINTELMVETGLLGWDRLDDDNGPIPYSKETARKLLSDPENENLRDAVWWACAMVSRKKSVEADNTSKNS